MSSFGSHKYIIVAPSGTGKSTMAEAMKDLGLERCITYTTRPPRPNEIITDAYYFERSLVGLDLFEHSEFGGYQYGITKEDLAAGDFVILEPQGVDFYRKHYPGPLTVITLQREGIDVDPERRERDEGAGFDKVVPDITVYGETIDTMRENLIAALISYEMNRRRETGISYLPEFTSSIEAIGTVRLCFMDSEYDLPVMSEEKHRTYLDPDIDDDGIDSFGSANYDILMNVFERMVASGKECSLNFSLQDERLKLLYTCHLTASHGKIHGELFPEYLLMEPFCFDTYSAKKAVDLAMGGFVAAENDVLGIHDSHYIEPALLHSYRKELSNGRFTLSGEKQAHKIPLSIQISNAEKHPTIHLKKIFDTPLHNYEMSQNER